MPQFQCTQWLVWKHNLRCYIQDDQFTFWIQEDRPYLKIKTFPEQHPYPTPPIPGWLRSAEISKLWKMGVKSQVSESLVSLTVIISINIDLRQQGRRPCFPDEPRRTFTQTIISIPMSVRNSREKEKRARLLTLSILLASRCPGFRFLLAVLSWFCFVDRTRENDLSCHGHGTSDICLPQSLSSPFRSERKWGQKSSPADLVLYGVTPSVWFRSNSSSLISSPPGDYHFYWLSRTRVSITDLTLVAPTAWSS